MADSFIQVSPDSTGKKVDTTNITVGANSVERERHNISDPVDAAGLAKVEAAEPAASDYGLVVRSITGWADRPMRVDPTGTTVQPVSGTLTANQGTPPWTQRIQDGAGATLATVTAANALKVDGSAVTQPVSGTVTANQGTPPWTQRIQDGAGASLAAVSNSSPSGGAAQGLVVRNIPVKQQFASPVTTAALGISGVFTSAWQDTQAEATTFVEASARADVASAANGFVIQENDDTLQDANFTRTVASVSVPANTTTFLSANIKARFWRIQYTNGGTAQTSFKLEATASSQPPLNVNSAGTLLVDGSAVTQPVSGTVTANIGTTGGLALDATVAGLQVAQGSTTAGQKGDLVQGAVTTAAPAYTTGQTNPLSLNTSGGLRVDVAQAAGVALPTGNGVTGTGSPRVTLASDNSAIANWGQGATGAAVPSGAQQIGGRAATTNPAAVTAGQLVGLMTDILGKLVVRAEAPRERVVQNTITLTTMTETTLIAAGGAGVFRDLTMITIANTSATGVRVDIRDATAGTVVWSLWVPATQTIGAVLRVPFKQTTAANNWTAQLSAAVTDVRITAQAIETA